MPVTNEATGSAVEYGVLAHCYTGQQRPLEVLRSAAGYYIGTLCEEDGMVLPLSRESAECFASAEEARRALADGCWTQRPNP